MEHLEVNPSRLASAAQAIKDASGVIDDTIAELERSASVLRGQWSGDAQVAFDTAQARFADLMDSRTEIVRTICTALDQVAVGYSTVDLESARALGATA